MEQWQRDHIRKHLVELIKNTTINTHLIATLKAKNILTDNDAEEIEHQMLIPSEKTRKLYEILQNKLRSFEVLIQTLTEAKQSGAAKILREHTSKFRDYGSISLDKNHLMGTGASSKVFKGKFENREVAVKVLHTDLVDVEMIIREVEFLRKLDSHENIIRHFVAESHKTCIYIALELCVISLQDEVNIKLLKIDPTSTLLQCAKGLNHLHSHNVVHRDLKPANILLTASKQVKIADFGLSKQIPIGRSSIPIHSGGFGTADWMAPEILEYLQDGITRKESFRMSKSADIFSLGCLFYFTLTNGFHPFGSNLERLYNISNHKPKLTKGRYSDDWIKLISKMISRSSTARPTTKEILNFKHFAPSQSPHVSSDKADLNDDPQTKNEDSMLKTKSVPLGTTEISPKNQRHSKSVSPMIAEKLRAFTMSTNVHSKTKKPHLEENQTYSLTTDVKRCIEKCNQKLQEEEFKDRGFTLLHMAILEEHKATVEHLISQGADINRGDGDGITPLHLSCHTDNSFETIFPILLKNGGDINAGDESEESILCIAIYAGRSKASIEAIVRAGADINKTFARGETVMHAAVESGKPDLLKYFVSLGMDIHSKDGQGRSPLHYIVNGVTNYSEMLNGDEIFYQVLTVALDNGANINAVNNRGESTLHLATRQRLSNEKLEAFVRAGADVNLKNSFGLTVMHLAVQCGNVEALEYFTRIRRNIHERCDLGWAPIHYLMETKRNFDGILNVLLQRGVDINSRDQCGSTLLESLVLFRKPQEHIDLVKRLGGTSRY